MLCFCISCFETRRGPTFNWERQRQFLQPLNAGEYKRYLSLASISAKVALATSLDNKRQLHLPAQLHRRLARASYARLSLHRRSTRSPLRKHCTHTFTELTLSDCSYEDPFCSVITICEYSLLTFCF